MSINLLNHLHRLEIYADWKLGNLRRLETYTDWKLTQTGNLRRLETYADWKLTQTGNLHRRETYADWKFTQTGNLRTLYMLSKSVHSFEHYLFDLFTIYKKCISSQPFVL